MKTLISRVKNIQISMEMSLKVKMYQKLLKLLQLILSFSLYSKKLRKIRREKRNKRKTTREKGKLLLFKSRKKLLLQLINS